MNSVQDCHLCVCENSQSKNLDSYSIYCENCCVVRCDVNGYNSEVSYSIISSIDISALKD